MKKDTKLLLVSFVIGSALFFTITSKLLSDDRGIDVEMVKKNDRIFDFKLFYMENDRKDFNVKEIKIQKFPSFQNIKLKLNIKNLKKLKLDFGIRPNNIWIKEIKIIGKNEITIPFDIIENSEHENMYIFLNQQKAFYMKS